ncbi:hypothetical protein AGMMS4956_01600 [Bacteroidia bacterium]|nr:hypothetical protein AGMMS4956_01600 [Bacteroidia bacterium]
MGCAVALLAQGTTTAGIIPLPQKCTLQAGEFVVKAKTKIVLNPNNAQMQKAVTVMKDLLKTAAGFALPVSKKATDRNVIICTLNPNLKHDEAYKLWVQKDKITIEAKTPHGVFYAMQTLRQLLPPAIEKKTVQSAVKWTIPCLEIEDAPRYNYRGLHLDVGRHFMTQQEVMRYIDLLAYHKMNIFHWHLTDDQGWRIEIKKYPKLTKVGAWREQTKERTGELDSAGKYIAHWDNRPHGGFYTQAEVKEVIAYAQKRFVTVIPEIDMPGHSLAALAAYPKFSCSGGPFRVEGQWGIFEDIFCAGQDATFAFLEDILTEIIAIFPSPYIHIGGDEVPKTRWERCHACQTRMKELGIKGEHQLQSYFITRISMFLAAKGKSVIGWDEVLEGGLAPDVIVMSWRGIEGGIEAAEMQHNVIMTPRQYVYLDYAQDEASPAKRVLPLQKTYSYDPTPVELTPEEAQYILGVQGNVWTEHIPTFERVLYMAFPRAAAIAEVGWTQKEQKNFDNFKLRLQQIAAHYDAMGIQYYQP